MQQTQAVFRAISDPTRREIIGLLADTAMTVGDVAAQFEITRPAVAKHLRILREGGVITVVKKGRETINTLRPEALKSVSDWLAHYSRFWDDKLNKLKIAVENDND